MNVCQQASSNCRMCSDERAETYMYASEHTTRHTQTLHDSCDMPENSPTMTRNKSRTKITITASTNPPLYSFSLGFFFQKTGASQIQRERSERSRTKPPFTLMAGLLNACVHSGLFLVVSGRLRVLQLTVSSRF